MVRTGQPALHIAVLGVASVAVRRNRSLESFHGDVIKISEIIHKSMVEPDTLAIFSALLPIHNKITSVE